MVFFLVIIILIDMVDSNIEKIIKTAFPQINIVTSVSGFINHKNTNKTNISDEEQNLHNNVVSETSIEDSKINNVEFEYNAELNNKENKNSSIKINFYQGGVKFYFAYFVQVVLFFLAIYLSFKCNKGFNLLDFLLACCCTPCYIIYRLAVPCKDLTKTVNSVIKNISTNLK